MQCTSWKCLDGSSLGRARDNFIVFGFRLFLLPMLVLCSSTTLSASERVNESVIDFHIPQQALSSALIEFAEQAGSGEMVQIGIRVIHATQSY